MCLGGCADLECLVWVSVVGGRGGGVVHDKVGGLLIAQHIPDKAHIGKHTLANTASLSHLIHQYSMPLYLPPFITQCVCECVP